MKAIKHLSVFAIIAATAALTGCGSDGPSSKQAKAAIESIIEQEISSAKGLVGSKGADTMRSMMPKINSVEVLSCEKLQDRVARCVVKVEGSLMGQTHSDTSSLSFVKGSDGVWTAMK